MKITHAITNLSYATSRSYPVWLVSSIFVFIPGMIVAVAIIKGPFVAPSYLIGKARKLNLTRSHFLAAKAEIANEYHRNKSHE